MYYKYQQKKLVCRGYHFNEVLYVLAVGNVDIIHYSQRRGLYWYSKCSMALLLVGYVYNYIRCLIIAIVSIHHQLHPAPPQLSK